MFFVGTIELSLVLRWALEFLERRVSSGAKALVMVHCILPLRAVNAASKALVDLNDISVLLRKTMSDSHRTVEDHNRSLHLSDGCVKIVDAMRLFWIWRCYVPMASQLLWRSLDDQPVIEIEIEPSFDQTGWLKSISEGLVSHLHDEWSETMNSIAQYRAFISQQRFGRLVGPMLIGNKPRGLSNWTTLHGRSASEPRIDRGQPRRVRLRSLAPSDWQ